MWIITLNAGDRGNGEENLLVVRGLGGLKVVIFLYPTENFCAVSNNIIAEISNLTSNMTRIREKMYVDGGLLKRNA